MNKEQLQETIVLYNSYPQNTGVHPAIWINTVTGEAWESPIIGESWRETTDHIIRVNVDAVLRCYGSVTADTVIAWYQNFEQV